MYKVFVNDKPIIITSSSQKVNNFPVYLFKDIVIDELLYKLNNEPIKGITLYSSDLEKDWKKFKKYFKVVPAAGGLVTNSKKEYLFIYRNEIWDLPKGRIEKGESIEVAAVREVEEECGVYNLKIQEKIVTTYHIFFREKLRLKETHWFYMKTDYEGELKPQLEEGITEVVFKNKIEAQEALSNTYANIKLVFDCFKAL